MHITYLQVEIITNDKKNQVRPEINLQPQIIMGVCGVQYTPDVAQYLARQEYTKLFLSVGGTGNGCINKPQYLIENCFSSYEQI